MSTSSQLLPRLLLAASLAWLAWSLVRVALLLALPPAAAAPLPGGGESITWHWFGDAAQAAPTRASGAAIPEAAVGGTQLVGVVTRGAQRLAILSTGSGRERVVREGQGLEGGLRIAAVETNRILLEGSGGTRQLSLRRLAEAATPPASTLARPGAAGKPDWRAQLQQQLYTVLVEGESVQGLRLDGIPPTALGTGGLERGDLLLELDGEPVASMLAADDIAERLLSLPAAELRVLRRDAAVTISVSGDALREMLRGMVPALAQPDEV
jgi:hypothetical protein